MNIPTPSKHTSENKTLPSIQIDMKEHENNTHKTSQTHDPAKIAFHLLDILFKNEHEGINYLKELNTNGTLDNFEFSDQFQKILSVNLLKAVPGYNYFISYAFDLFKWNDTIAREPFDSIFSVTLQNLSNQIQPFKFFQYLKHISQIKNGFDALEKKLDWNECQAARALFKRPNFLINFLIIRFNKQKARAILTLIKEIEENHPSVISMGLNISSITWWNNFQRSKIKKYIYAYPFTLIWIGIIISPILTSYFNHTINLPKDTYDYKSPTGHYDLFLDNKIDISETPNFYSEIPGSNQYMPTLVKTKNGTFMSDANLSRLLKTNDINVEKIFQKELQEQINLLNKSQMSNKLYSESTLKIRIDKFGLIQNTDSDRFVPLLIIYASLTDRDGHDLGSKIFKYENSKLFGYSWHDLETPGVFKKILDSISEEMARNALTYFT